MAVGLQGTNNCVGVGISVERLFWFTDARFLHGDYPEGHLEAHRDLCIGASLLYCRVLFVVCWF